MSTIFSQQIIGGKLLLVLNCAFKKQTKSQLKKIVSETINFVSPNFTKPKKKPRNITKYHNIFTISFISSCGRSRSDILFFTLTIISQQILSGKLLLAIN